MVAANSPVRVFSRFIRIIFIFTSILTLTSVASADELTLVVSQNTTLELLPSVILGKSPGIKPGTKVLCERLRIQGLPRLKHLKKFPNSVRVKVAYAGAGGRPPGVEVCFHRNLTIGIGMCAQDQWEKLNKGSWMRSMSPFDHKLLDIRMAGSSAEPIEVSLHEEVFFYRVIFLVLGIAMMTLATFLSNSLVFYYSGAMAVGVLLVILMVLFQGMRLLPTGRKNSLAIFLYSCAVGFGTFLLRYVPRFLQTILNEIGIGEDMYNPLGSFLVLFLGITGAWLGFLVVRKLVLTEDGSIDVGVSYFVAWSIRILAAVMILQSSIDPLLAAEALVCSIFISLLLRRFGNLKFIRRLYRRLCRLRKGDGRKSQDNIQGFTTNSPPQRSTPETFYSTFHITPERRKFTKDEWNAFTRESTKRALESLVSSPDFNEWAVVHADRLTLAPEKEVSKSNYPHRWFHWF